MRKSLSIALKNEKILSKTEKNRAKKNFFKKFSKKSMPFSVSDRGICYNRRNSFFT